MSNVLTSPRYALSLLKVPVSDVARSVAFYRDAMGFVEGFVAEEYGWAQLNAGGLSLALFVPGMGGGDATVGGSAWFHLALTAPEFDALAERLQASKALVEDRIHQGNDGTTFIDAQDPDGNVLKVIRVD